MKVENIASNTTYAASGGGVIGFMTQSEDLIIVSVIVAILGFFVNLFFRFREDKRKSIEHKARMKALESTKDA